MIFILREMTFLRYFIPLIKSGNLLGIKSRIYWSPSSGKYNCPQRNYSCLVKLSEKYKFELIKIQGPMKTNDTCFFIEGVGIDLIKSPKKISITYMTDYQVLYSKYWDKID